MLSGIIPPPYQAPAPPQQQQYTAPPPPPPAPTSDQPPPTQTGSYPYPWPPPQYPPQQYPPNYPPNYQPPPQYPYPPPQQAYPPPPPAPTFGQVQVTPYSPLPAEAPRRGLPVWLMTILFMIGFGVLIVGGIWLFTGSKSGSASGGPPPTNVENPAAKAGAKLNPYQKYIEISGVRFTMDAKKKIEVKFVVTNHSGADISGLAANVTIWGRTQKSEEEAAGTFSFKGADVGPFESKNFTAPLTTKLPMVQLPDWQNISTDVQVTAPGS